MKTISDSDAPRFQSARQWVGWQLGWRALLVAGVITGNLWPSSLTEAAQERDPFPTQGVPLEVNVMKEGGLHKVPQVAGVSAKDNILVFRSLETYEKAYPIIFNMSAEQGELWEKSLGFVSQRNIFNQIVKAEYAFLVAPYESKSASQLKRIRAPKGHTEIYQKSLQSGLIRTQRDASGEETYTSSIPIGGYLPIVNQKGYFVVGEKVYQVTNSAIKEMAGFDASKVSALEKASSDDDANGIKVFPVIENAPKESSKVASNCSYPRSTGWITSGSRRGMTTVNFSKIYWNPYPYTKVTVTYDVNVKSQKKNFWGSWVYPSCPNECWISLTWTAVFDFISKTTLGYAGSSISPRSYSYPHPNCMNDFRVSLNPITSLTAPYPSNFTFTAPSGLAFQDVSFTNANWHASVPGGSSGITCSVTCP